MQEKELLLNIIDYKFINYYVYMRVYFKYGFDGWINLSTGKKLERKGILVELYNIWTISFPVD